MPDANDYHTPPLRIRHLLLWMAALALVATWRLALNAHIAASPHGSPGNTPADILRYSIVQVFACSGMLVITGLGAAWKLRDRSIVWAPGMWLAAIGTADFSYQLVGTLPMIMDGPSGDGALVLHVYRDLSFTAVIAIVLIALTVMPRREWQWRIAFMLLATHHVLAAIGIAMFIDAVRTARGGLLAGYSFWHINDYAYYATVSGGLAVAIASSVDLIKPFRMGWTHWAGVSLWLFFFALTNAFQFVKWLRE
jgi:hypothetical protein